MVLHTNSVLPFAHARRILRMRIESFAAFDAASVRHQVTTIDANHGHITDQAQVWIYGQSCCKSIVNIVANIQSMIKMWHECMVKLKCKCIVCQANALAKLEL